MRSTLRRALCVPATGAALLALLSTSAAAQTSSAQLHSASHGSSKRDSAGVLQLAKVQSPKIAASQSSNWFGYDQGALEQDKLFTEVGGTWTVPTASAHTAGQEESSADWVGIGGGCVNEGCTVSDPSGLIQTGTEQNVATGGSADYGAWYELVPLPSTPIEGMTISPGDRISAKVSEVSPEELPQALEELPSTLGGVSLTKALQEMGVSGGALQDLRAAELGDGSATTDSSTSTGAGEVPSIGGEAGTPGLGIWRITLTDVTTGQTATETVPYPSSHASAEWIEETPLGISTEGVGLTALPNLTETPFSAATVNGGAANLAPSQAIDLVEEGSEAVIGTVSEPTEGGSGFGACAWTEVCPAPAS